MLHHLGSEPLQTQRLRLRRYRAEDVADMWQNYATDERVTRYLPWPPYTDIRALEAYVAEQLAAYADDVYNWVIEYEGQVVGSISAVAVDSANECCEIGYCLGHAFWGKGLMTEAVTEVLRFLFCEAGFHRVFAKHDAGNPGSGQVMQKCGMVREGRLRQHFCHGQGRYSDCLLYGILAGEFAPGR